MIDIIHIIPFLPGDNKEKEEYINIYKIYWEEEDKLIKFICENKNLKKSDAINYIKSLISSNTKNNELNISYIKKYLKEYKYPDYKKYINSLDQLTSCYKKIFKHINEILKK